MPMTVTYRHPKKGTISVSGLTKVEGVWDQKGNLTHYVLFEGDSPTQHRFAGTVPASEMLGITGNIATRYPERGRRQQEPTPNGQGGV